MKNKFRQFFYIKDFLCESLKENKIKTILIFSFSLLFFLVGIIIAVNTGAYNPDNIFGYALKDGSFKIITSSFFSRMLSLILISAILFVLSLCKFLFPIGVLLIGYRAYLLGLNICFMIILYGLSGAILAFFIILPCHLLAIFVLSCFYISSLKTKKDFCNFGGYRYPKQKLFLFTTFFISILMICILESILLVIFSANVILVI